ncbi:acyl-homoserine-lactone synthase [Stenotrophomonas acidaminiphila]|uniref:acyl-homoserine-lactone synthase n=1 Tax=Stenotrophomonas acidaminiphila TaxID=128780 RepID=UPI0028ADF5E2|nr:acyl-homoserine-lactone synthase [Stenotrophomonas acidaminiphila]
MEFILASAGDLSPLLTQALGRYRHRVFVETLGWQLDTPPGIERDRFDRPETVHVIVRDDQLDIVGYARLLPTTGPYLLGEMFPQLMNGQPPPCSNDVWELSRFAVMDLRGARTGVCPQRPSALAVDILQLAADYVERRGGKRLITVSPLAMERLLRRTGFHVHRAAPPQMIEGHPTFACWIELAGRPPWTPGERAGPVNSDSYGKRTSRVKST